MQPFWADISLTESANALAAAVVVATWLFWTAFGGARTAR